MGDNQSHVDSKGKKIRRRHRQLLNPLARIQLALRTALDGPDSEIVSNESEDSEDWLNVDFDNLDATLQNIQDGTGLRLEDLDDIDESDDSDDDIPEDVEKNDNIKFFDDGIERDLTSAQKSEKKQLKNLKNVVKQFGNFVQKESGIDGVLFPG